MNKKFIKIKVHLPVIALKKKKKRVDFSSWGFTALVIPHSSFCLPCPFSTEGCQPPLSSHSLIYALLVKEQICQSYTKAHYQIPGL